MESAFFGTRRAAGLLQQFRRLSFLIKKTNLFLGCAWMHITTVLKNSVVQQLVFNHSSTFLLSFSLENKKPSRSSLPLRSRMAPFPLTCHYSLVVLYWPAWRATGLLISSICIIKLERSCVNRWPPGHLWTFCKPFTKLRTNHHDIANPATTMSPLSCVLPFVVNVVIENFLSTCSYSSVLENNQFSK